MDESFFLYRLTWNTERNKYDKQPCSLDGQRWPVSPRDNLVSLDVAQRALSALPVGEYALGMWIAPGSGLFFLDLDDCVTDGRLSDEAARIAHPLVSAGAFFEASSSGRGAHVIGRYMGALPAHCNRRPGVHKFEFYTGERGVALNLAASQGSMDADCTALLATMLPDVFPPRVTETLPVAGRRPEWRGPEDDDELIRRALSARGSARQAFGHAASFADLWSGNVPEDDRSAADMALASHLAFWTGCDVDRIERLMRRSGLAREKWNEHRKYLRGLTIAHACATTANVYQDPQQPAALPVVERPRIRNGADLDRQEFAPTTWIIRDVLPAGITLLSGDPKAGKSFLSLQFAFSIATGCPLWNGRSPEKQGRALYLALEDTDRRMKKRLSGVKMDRGLFNVDMGKFDYATDWPRGEAGVEEIRSYLTANPDCRLVIIDTIAAWRNQDTARLSAYQADYQVGEMLKPLGREFDIALLLVHHNRKQASDDATQKISGTNGLLGSVDGALILEKPTRGAEHSSLVITGRDIDHPGELAIARTATGFWSCLGKAEEVARSAESQAVLDALRSLGGMGSLRDIQMSLEEAVKIGTLKTRLSRMVKRGEIFRNSHDDYSLPSSTPQKLPEPPSIIIDPPAV